MQELTPKNIALVVGGFLLTVLLLFGAWKISSKSQVSQKVDIKVEASDQTRGKKDAKVILVEYADFQCPACKAYHPVVKALMQKYKEQILFVYRNFPLASHKNGPRAAAAAQAAGLQGKFWEMHDKLFETQDSWAKETDPTKTFIQFAKELKLDTKQFEKDINASEVKAKVDKDRDGGISYQVNATPTFFLNGVKLSSPQSLNEFDGIIEKEIESINKK